MNEINLLEPTATAAALRDPVRPSPSKIASDGASSPADRVEISELAKFLSSLGDLPDNRARKVVAVRSSIAEGSYETPEKLNYAIDRLLDRL